ncbi:MAG TPA: HNH endonuclease signature motif containing protein [Anaeromyxobacteraceae bacterium]|nr:HNH endonuclease signature motif containing protein [Anaeromyxobacteraceae bacterium]
MTAVSAATTVSRAATAVSGAESGPSSATSHATALGRADLIGIGAAAVTPEAPAPVLLTGLPTSSSALAVNATAPLNGTAHVEHRVDAAREVRLAPASAASAASPAPSPPRAPQRLADEVQPLSADLRRLHVTVSRRFLAKLDAARDALSHSRAGSTTEDVLEAALDLLLQQQARRKGVVAKPRRTGRPLDAATSGKRREREECAAAGSGMRREEREECAARVSSGGAAAGSNVRPGGASKGPAALSSGGAAGTNAALDGASGEPAQVASRNITDRSGQRRDPGRDGADGTNTALGAASGEPAAASRQLLLAAPPGPPPKSDRIPASVRREVWKRDRGRCQWPLSSGGICGSTLRLEFDHIVPRARGGPSTIENLRVLCRVHNQHSARRAFGDEWMDRYGRSGTGERNRRSGSG